MDCPAYKGLDEVIQGMVQAEKKKPNMTGINTMSVLGKVMTKSDELGILANLTDKSEPIAKAVVQELQDLHNMGVFSEQMNETTVRKYIGQVEDVLSKLTDKERKKLSYYWSMADDQKNLNVFLDNVQEPHIREAQQKLSSILLEIHERANANLIARGKEPAPAMDPSYFPRTLDPGIVTVYRNTWRGRVTYGTSTSAQQTAKLQHINTVRELYNRIPGAKQVHPSVWSLEANNWTKGFVDTWRREGLKLDNAEIFGKDFLDIRKEVEKVYGKDYDQWDNIVTEYDQGMIALNKARQKEIQEVKKQIFNKYKTQAKKKYVKEDVPAATKEFKGKMKEFLKAMNNDFTAEELRDFLKSAAINIDEPIGKTGKTIAQQLDNLMPTDIMSQAEKLHLDDLNKLLKQYGLPDTKTLVATMKSPEKAKPFTKPGAYYENVFQESLKKEKFSPSSIKRTGSLLSYDTEDIEKILTRYIKAANRKIFFDDYLDQAADSIQLMNELEKAHGVDLHLTKKEIIGYSNYLVGQSGYMDRLIASGMYDKFSLGTASPWSDFWNGVRGWFSWAKVGSNPGTPLVNLTQQFGDISIYGPKAYSRAKIQLLRDLIDRKAGKQVDALDFFDHIGLGDVTNVIDDVTNRAKVDLSDWRNIVGTPENHKGLINLFDAFGKSEKANRVMSFYVWREWMKINHEELKAAGKFAEAMKWRDPVEMWKNGNIDITNPSTWKNSELGIEFRKQVQRGIEGVNATNYNYGRSNKPGMLRDPLIDLLFGQFQIYGTSQMGRLGKMLTRGTMKPDPDRLFNVYQLASDVPIQTALGGTRAVTGLGALGLIGLGLAAVGMDPHKWVEKKLNKAIVDIRTTYNKMADNDPENADKYNLLADSQTMSLKAIRGGIGEALTNRDISSKFDQSKKDQSLVNLTPAFAVLAHTFGMLTADPDKPEDREKHKDKIKSAALPSVVLNTLNLLNEWKATNEIYGKPVPKEVDWLIQRIGVETLGLTNLAKQRGLASEFMSDEVRRQLIGLGVDEEIINQYDPVAGIASRFFGFRNQKASDIQDAISDMREIKNKDQQQEEKIVTNILSEVDKRKSLGQSIDEIDQDPKFIEKVQQMSQGHEINSTKLQNMAQDRQNQFAKILRQLKMTKAELKGKTVEAIQNRNILNGYIGQIVKTNDKAQLRQIYAELLSDPELEKLFNGLDPTIRKALKDSAKI